VSDVIKEIEIDQLRVSPFQPRRVFSDEELEELSSSIQSVGLIHPPVVREVKAGEKILYYELIAGERRWRALKRAGFEKIPVIIRTSSDEMAAKATLIENIQRVDLDPMEMALAYKRLLDVFRMTQEEVAEKVGKKRSTVANYLRLLTLPDPIKEDLSAKNITMGHAKAILSLESPELKESLHQLILDKKLNVRDAEKESTRLSKKKRKPVEKKNNDHASHLKLLEERLQEVYQTKVEIQSNGKKGGKVSIQFYSNEDLQQLVLRLENTRTIEQSMSYI
jgi:ParB family transcriptional regulator, chromosome partitioning protein